MTKKIGALGGLSPDKIAALEKQYNPDNVLIKQLNFLASKHGFKQDIVYELHNTMNGEIDKTIMCIEFASMFNVPIESIIKFVIC